MRTTMWGVFARRRWIFVCLVVVLAVVAPSIWSLELRRPSERAHLRPAFEEVVRIRGGNKTAMEREEALGRAREAFFNTNETWNKEQAIANLARGITQGDFDLAHDQKRFEILPKPLVHLDAPLVWDKSRQFVESVQSVARRYSILEESAPDISKKLDHNQLRDYLKDTVKVTDYGEVTESFEPALTVDVVTFTEPTPLLRLYGGTAKAIGRYFFCCPWPVETASDRESGEQGPTHFWSDASGLATPPENLRDHLAVATIPAGTAAIIGTVADNFPDPLGHFGRGGNTQIFIPHVEAFPFQEFRFAGDKGAVFEIELQLDDTVLRFRQ